MGVGSFKLYTDQKIHFMPQKPNVTAHTALHQAKNEKGNKIFSFHDSSDVSGDYAGLLTTGHSIVSYCFLLYLSQL